MTTHIKAMVLDASKHGDILLRTKFVDEGTGRIEGYASTFNNVDRVKDRVMPGAFGERPFTVPYLAYHNPTTPIGNCLCTPDDIGLASVATLANTATAQEVRELARAGAIPAQSIGYNITASEPNEFGGLDLYKLEVLEVSAVPIPANPLALITTAKAFGAAGAYDGPALPPGASKVFTDDLIKALGRITAGIATQAEKASMRSTLQQIHDAAVKAGAECGKSHHATTKDLALELASWDVEHG